MRSRLLLVLSLSCLFLTGTDVGAQNPDSTVFLSVGDSLRVGKDDIKLALTPVRSTKRGAIIGAIAGGSVGLVGGTIVVSNMSTLFGGRRNLPKSIGAGVLLGVGGAACGALVGATIGTLVYRDEWKRVKVQGTSVSVSF